MVDVTDWLVEDENPAIKYRTMTEIFGKSFEESEEVYDLIWKQKPILKMLKRQDESGLWRMTGLRDADSMRYLTAFAEYGLCKDGRLDRYVEYIINLLQSWEKQEVDVFTCYAPMTLRALVMLGYHETGDVMELISKFASTQIFDGGFMCKRQLAKKPARKSCYKASVSGLLLYAECKRKNILPANADDLINYFLKRDVFYSSDKIQSFIDKDGTPKGFPGDLMKMGIPLIVSALSILGAGNHPALQKAWKMLNERKGENDRFRLDGLAKQPGIYGKDGRENKWATFYAVLAKTYRTI